MEKSINDTYIENSVVEYDEDKSANPKKIIENEGIEMENDE